MGLFARSKGKDKERPRAPTPKVSEAIARRLPGENGSAQSKLARESPPEGANLNARSPAVPAARPRPAALFAPGEEAAPESIPPETTAAVAQPGLPQTPGRDPGSEPAVEHQPSRRERRKYLDEMCTRLHQQLLARLDVDNLRTLTQEVVRRETRVAVQELCQSEKGLLTLDEQRQLADLVLDETFGLGPLEPLLKDPTISDILVNRHDQIYVERNGRVEMAEVLFRDEKHLRQVIDRIVARIGRRVDEFSPMVDARLEDGSRVNAIIPPLALDGSAMSIRRFGSKPLAPEDLIGHGAFPVELLTFLAAAVQARCNIIISGGTGSGKTTLLNCLSRYIPTGERVITIEDAAELQLHQPHVVRLETRPANIEGKGEVTQRDLVKNCLRMRPDRIIIGEVRGAEAVDMLQAMNTGHDGSMTTIHANNARDALSRLEVTLMMAGYDIPVRAMRQQISSALNLVVQAQRLLGGRRKVTRVSEITGMEGDRLQMHDLFKFEHSGVTPDGHADGAFIACGVRPHCLERIEQAGLHVPPELFSRRILPSATAIPVPAPITGNGSTGGAAHAPAGAEAPAAPSTNGSPRRRLICVEDSGSEGGAG